MMAKPPRSLCLAATLSLALCAPLPGLQIHDYEKGRHLRFEEGSYSSHPVPNETLWVNDHVFNGVGWSADDPVRSYALISPRHFVGADHFRPAIGSQIQFLSTDGQLRSYTYEKLYNIQNTKGENTDIFIGQLSGNIPASHNVPLYPVLQASEAALVGQQILVYGRGQSGPRIGRGIIGTFNDSFGPGILGTPLNDTRNYTFEYVESAASRDDCYAESGDSGSPSFIPVDGMLTLSGTHSAILQTTMPGTGTVNTTYDSFILHYQDQINDHLATTGHKLTLAPVANAPLEIVSIDLSGTAIVLSVANASGLPYDVLRTSNAASGDWELVATSQTGSDWVEEVPPDADRLFWKLIPYPLPGTAAERE